MADKQALQQRLDELQKEYSKTKYNKATNKYLGILRAKMAKVRRAMAEKKSKKGTGFGVRKSGDATVVLVGFPNAGKSSLLGRLTNAESKVADYAFTTLDVIPGMLEYNGAKIQVLDVPGLIEGAHLGKGAGTQIASVMRSADLLLFVIDATAPEQFGKLLEELSLLDIKVGREKPKVMIEEKSSGGLFVEGNGHKVPTKDDVAAVLREVGTYNGKIIFYSDMNLDELVSLLIDNAVYVKGMVALNKIDLVSASAAEQIKKKLQEELNTQVVAVSATKNSGLESLKVALFGNLGLVRVYLKPKDGEADMKKPFIMRGSGSVMELARGLHSKAAKNLKYAYITGRSARFRNQKVGSEHMLQDGDVITLIYDKF